MGGLYDEQMVNELHQGAQSLVNQWGLSEATDVKLLTVSENATFKAHDPIANKTVILRVHRPGYRTKSEIESELSWIKALRTEGIVETPEPLKTRSGDLVASFKTAHEERDVVAFSFMEGKEPSPDESLIDGFRQLGAISARLHLHAQSWERPVSFVRKTWNFNTTLGNSPLWGDWRAAMGLTEAGKALLEKTCEKVAEKTGCLRHGQ